MADNLTVTPGSGATVAADDVGGNLHQRVKLSLGADGSAIDAVGGAGTTSAAVQRVTLASDDPAVTSLAAVLAKIIAAPATEAKQDAQLTLLAALANYLDGVESGQASILAKIIAAPATEAKQDAQVTQLTAIAGYVDGLEGALASILAKIIAAPATEAKQDTANTSLAAIDTKLGSALPLPTGAATQTTLAAILAKIIAAPATEAKQDTLLGVLPAARGANGGLKVEGVAGGQALPVSGSVSVTGTAAVSGTVSLTDISNGEYETVAASQTDQSLGATGAAGDYLSGVLIVPATTSPGAVSIKDGAGSAITVFTGGASSVSNLVPFFVPLGIKSGAGAWKVTTGSNVSAIGVGNFT